MYVCIHKVEKLKKSKKVYSKQHQNTENWIPWHERSLRCILLKKEKKRKFTLCVVCSSSSFIVITQNLYLLSDDVCDYKCVYYLYCLFIHCHGMNFLWLSVFTYVFPINTIFENQKGLFSIFILFLLYSNVKISIL